VVVICLGVYLAYSQFFGPDNSQKKKQKADKNLATVYDEKRIYGKAIDNNLKNGDIQSYLNAKVELANRYIAVNDYNNASSTIDDIKKNVPADKLSSYYYQIKIQIDDHNGDITAKKADLQSIIIILKENKQTSTAEYYQKQLDKL
jgi:Tfp pilus assembly protein PilF